MKLRKIPFSILLLIICLNFVSCDDSNPTTALPPLTEENFDITVNLADSGNLNANVMVRNHTQYNWEKTIVNLAIIEIESGHEYNRSLDLGEIEVDGSKRMLLISTQQVQGELCYNYRLMVTPEGEDDQVSYEGGTCSN